MLSKRTMDCFNDKKVLILGASGQIGKELLGQLNNFNCTITAVRQSPWEETVFKKIKYVNLDLYKINDEELIKLIESHDYIFHLAGNTSVIANPENEEDYLLNWILPLNKILKLMLNSDKTLIFSSSASVYGVNTELPISEDSIEQPYTSYDLAKTHCDNLIRYYKNAYKVNCVSMRFSNVYGPQTSISKESRRIINKILDIIHLEKEISIVKDGEYFRNYIHVSDVASMMIYCAKNIMRSPSIVMACSPENMKFSEVIELLVELYTKRFNKKIKIQYGLKERFITDTRSFISSPSSFFKNDFKFKYNIRKGFKELVELIE